MNNLKMEQKHVGMKNVHTSNNHYMFHNKKKSCLGKETMPWTTKKFFVLKGQTYPSVVPLGMSHFKFLKPIQFQKT